MEFKLGELFSGPGGLALGAFSASVKSNGEKFKIVHGWASDYDPDTQLTYTHNLCAENPETFYLADVRKVNFSKLPKVDAFAYGFPCNDFGGQEPGTLTEIKSFCSKNYGVTFPMMEKISVKGEKCSEIYKWLTSKAENGVEDSKVNWNFNKYLINEKGEYVKHLGSSVNPLDKEVTQWISSN